MENGNVISLRPETGTLVILQSITTSPLAKVGRSAATEATSRREFFNMLIMSVKVVRSNFSKGWDQTLGSNWRKSHPLYRL